MMSPLKTRFQEFFNSIDPEGTFSGEWKPGWVGAH
jgi:hypothetical protein